MLMAAILMCGLPAHAQLGNLINKGINAANKVKQVKDKVDDAVKKSNGDVDFYYMDSQRGFYRSKNRKIIFNDLHKDGKNVGKKIIYTIEKNGDIKYDDGTNVGNILAGGVVNCRNSSPYLTLASNGDVVMDNEVIGHIDNQGNVTLEGKKIGQAPGIDKQVAAYIYFGILLDKQGIATARAKAKEERLRAQQQRQQAEEARRQAATTSQTKSGQSSGKKATQQKVQEWTIEKGSSRGYVDANGVVYDWAHKKIGQLPNGSGDIKDGSGSTIGRISMGDIYDRNGNKVCTVSSGGSISVPGSTATVAEVHAAGRIDWSKDSRTIGYCDVRPYEWAVAIIFCDIFDF